MSRHFFRLMSSPRTSKAHTLLIHSNSTSLKETPLYRNVGLPGNSLCVTAATLYACVILKGYHVPPYNFSTLPSAVFTCKHSLVPYPTSPDETSAQWQAFARNPRSECEPTRRTDVIGHTARESWHMQFVFRIPVAHPTRGRIPITRTKSKAAFRVVLHKCSVVNF
jgi:hypothetical protein